MPIPPPANPDRCTVYGRYNTSVFWVPTPGVTAPGYYQVVHTCRLCEVLEEDVVAVEPADLISHVWIHVQREDEAMPLWRD